MDIIKRQKDLIILKERDYIRNPKSNGYRSYHIVFGVPVYHTDGMDYYPVELQLRTMSMDFWASMEHRILYKKSARIGRDRLAAELKQYADMLVEIESRFELHSEGKQRQEQQKAI